MHKINIVGDGYRKTITTKNQKGYFSAVRFFAIPIENTGEEESFAFVDSDYERAFLRDTISQKKVFIKPIGNEFNRTSSKLRSVVSNNGKVLSLINRPDVIIFNKDNTLEIVKIAGMSDASYKNQLKTKIQRYKEEIKRIDGEENCSVKIF